MILLNKIKDSSKNSQVQIGFGAPLWVVLLAVIGAGLLTVSIIVKEIKDRPDYKNQDQVRESDQVIVRHQFFILFAPLGAIFIYQALVIAEAATSPITVAIGVLGAGASLTVLMKKAVDQSADWLAKS